MCYCLSNKIVLTQKKSVIILNNVYILHNCDNENSQCADNQCLWSGVDDVGEFVARDTEECPLSVLSRVILEEICELFVGINITVRNKLVSVLSGVQATVVKVREAQIT